MSPTATGEYRPTSAHRAWAASVLGLDAAQTADALRAAALKGLASNEFAMWPQAELAVRVVAGDESCRCSPADREVLTGVQEAHLRKQVDRFCRKFFKLSVDERLRRLEVLRAACAPYPALRLRLSQLQFGAQVELPEFVDGEDADLAQLVQVVARCFVAWPVDAARIRRSELNRMSRPRWKKAAWQLYHRHAAVHGLAPELINALCGHAYAPQWTAAAQAAARKAPRPVADGAASRKPAKSRSLATYLVVAVLVGLVRFLASSADRPPRDAVPSGKIDQITGRQMDTDAFRDEMAKRLRDTKQLLETLQSRERETTPAPDVPPTLVPDMQKLLDAARRNNQILLEDNINQSRTGEFNSDRNLPNGASRPRPDVQMRPAVPRSPQPGSQEFRSPQPRSPQRPSVPQSSRPSIPQPAAPRFPSPPGGPRP